MGGITDVVRGKTKVETWLKFKKARRKILQRWEMSEHWPGNKARAYEIMRWDEEAEEWVLPFHFHT
jgi:hypothetical protein